MSNEQSGYNLKLWAFAFADLLTK